MIDTHAHLQDDLIIDKDEAIKRAHLAGVDKIICSSSDISTSMDAVKLAMKYESVFATVGVHPEEANTFDENTLFELLSLSKNPKVVAIGEIGLDYYHEFAGRQLQKEIFQKQIDLACELKLPIIVHTRDATGDTMEILRRNLSKLTYGVCIHCFNLSLEILKEIMGYGFYISIGGIVTFKNAKNVIDIVKECDLNKLMLETDSPYLAPVPLRGSINEPKNVIYSAQKIAEIRQISVLELEKITTLNAERFFKIGTSYERN